MSARTAYFAAIVAATLSCFTAASSALGAGDVVISQVWGKGQSVAANLPQASYVELFNRTANPIDMSTWSVQVATATNSSWQKLNLFGTIQPNSYYLVQVSGGSLNVFADEYFNPTNTILGAVGGPVGNKVVLRSSQDLLTVACPSGDPTIVDLVGLGASANCSETAVAPGISTSASGLTPTRNGGGCVDSDNNAADFTAMMPSPRNSASPQNTCGSSGACCDPLTGACSIDTSAGCTALGRSYIDDGAPCTPTLCGTLGSCCTALPGFCFTVTLSGCNTVSTGQWTSGVSCSSMAPGCGPSSGITVTACCFPDGTCCQIDQNIHTCTSLGGVAPGGASCNPAAGFVCSAGPPANDQCDGAFAMTLGVPRVGSNSAALANDFCQNLCNQSSFSVHGVWFKFTPAVSAQYDVLSCGTRFDSYLQILQVMGTCADPATWSYVACSDDGCVGAFPETGPCGATALSSNARINGVHMVAGETYYILLSAGGSSSGTGSSGNYKVQVSASAISAFGACCNSVTGQCESRSAAGCATSVPGAVYQGDSTTCTPTLCGLDVGACCNAGGCTLRTADYCLFTVHGNFLGGACLPSPCITGACCSRLGSCLAAIQFSQCYTNDGTYLGDNSTCTSVACPQAGACCYTNGICSQLTETACISPNPSPLNPQPGVFQGVGTTCGATACPQPGACCDAFQFCTFVLQSVCDSASTWTQGVSCSPTACAPTGVCCRGATCNMTVTQADCTGSGTAGAAYAAASTSCNSGAVSNFPCCYANYNKVNGVNVQDIFDFLSDWFAASPYAKVGSDGTSGPLTVQNIFDFLSNWFSGGC